MKKTVCLVLAVLLLCLGAAASASENTFDLKPLQENQYLTIDVNEEQNVAFVESFLQAGDTAFSHKGKSDSKYSFTWFDLLILNYGDESSAFPVMRLWVEVCTKDVKYDFDSITFTIDGKAYTFTGLYSADFVEEGEGGENLQRMLLKFGTENLEFLVALEALFQGTSSYEELMAISIPVVLHGTEDVSTEMGGAMLMDFMAIEDAYFSCNGASYLSLAASTPMTVADAE